MSKTSMTRLVTCLGLLCWYAPLLQAQSPYFPPALERIEQVGQVQVGVGSGYLLTLDDEVERVALADDTVARPQIISAREVLLTGLAPGRTTLYVWQIDGRRLEYLLRVERDLELILRAMRDLDRHITVESSSDGDSVILRGEVADRATAREAVARAQSLLGEQTNVLDLLRFPGYAATTEEQLTDALRSIDTRIRVRRIQVGDEPVAAQDSFVLEGRVRNVIALKRAVTLAERQLGGVGGSVRAVDDETLQYQRTRGFFGSISSGGANQALQGADPPTSGLSAQIARGLVITSESGRVISLLEVDDLPQVLVSIRVVEVDRAKAKKLGINWRFDNDNVSLGSFISPGTSELPSGGRQADGRPTIANIASGNLVGSFVDKVTSVVAAIDFLEDKALARSVAEPNILTLSGEPATVVVGGEVPIPSTAVNQVTAIQGFFFQDFGVRLDIRPTVVDGDIIAIEASPSIVRPTPALGVGEVPGFQIQSVQTTARVQAGESLVLGGLLSFEEGIEESKIPGLGWLPGIGRWKRKSREERELLFIISPQLVENPRRTDSTERVVMPDLDAVAAPELDWPEGRDRWRDEFEPQEMRRDGVPPSFLPESEPEPRPRSDGAGAAPMPTSTAPSATAPDETTPALTSPTSTAPTPTTDEPEPELAWDEPTRAQHHRDLREAEFVLPEGPEIWVVAAEPCLNFRPQPGQSGEPLDCLPTGTRLDLLGDEGDWTKVRLTDGREGWVAGDYLSPILPGEIDSAMRLQELDAEREALKEQLESDADADQGLEDQLRSIQQEIERIRAEQEQDPR